MRLYLVRHGETLWNLESRFQGWADIPLSHKGQEQARTLQNFLTDVDFDAAYSSTLIRAKETAEIVVEDRGLEVHMREGLQEHGIGELEGLREKEIITGYPGVLEQLRDDPGNFQPPGGENLNQVQQRAWEALQALADENRGKTILLVAHHTVNKCLLLKLMDASFAGFRIIRQPPCTVSLIEMARGQNFVHTMNMNWQEKVSPWHDLNDDMKERLGNPEAVIFDLDGVLLDSIPSYAAAWRGALAEKGIFPAEIELYRREGEKAVDSVHHYFRQAGREIDENEVSEVIERIIHHYYSYPAAETYPGAFEVIRKLKTSGRKLALVTGSARSEMEQRLSESQRELFDAIVTQNDVENGKPHPEPYERALAALGVDAAKSIVVENAPFGIRSAKEAGLLTIGITNTLPREELKEADFVIDSLERLTGWMGI